MYYRLLKRLPESLKQSKLSLIPKVFENVLWVLDKVALKEVPVVHVEVPEVLENVTVCFVTVSKTRSII